MAIRSAAQEYQLVLMRLLSVLMSRTKAGTKPSSAEVDEHTSINYIYIYTIQFRAFNRFGTKTRLYKGH